MFAAPKMACKTFKKSQPSLILAGFLDPALGILPSLSVGPGLVIGFAAAAGAFFFR